MSILENKIFNDKDNEEFNKSLFQLGLILIIISLSLSIFSYVYSIDNVEKTLKVTLHSLIQSESEKNILTKKNKELISIKQDLLLVIHDTKKKNKVLAYNFIKLKKENRILSKYLVSLKTSHNNEKKALKESINSLFDN